MRLIWVLTLLLTCINCSHPSVELDDRADYQVICQSNALSGRLQCSKIYGRAEEVVQPPIVE